VADEKLNEPEDGMVVVMTDEDGNEYYYEEEMIIPVGEDEEEHDHECGCGCGCEEGDEDVIIAKIVVDENGEEEYIEPTDEEFELVQKAYDALLEEEEGSSE